MVVQGTTNLANGASKEETEAIREIEVSEAFKRGG